MTAPVSKQTLREYNKWRVESGLKPLPMPLDKHMVGLYISVEAERGLRDIAKQFGLLHGGKGSLGALLEGIGQGIYKVIVDPNITDTSEDEDESQDSAAE